MTKQTPKLPTHVVYAVTKKAGAKKGYWTKIGGLWPHRDGKGFSVQLSCVPQSNAEIVIRMPRSEGGAA